ncbi:MAG: carbohydrate-binding domain-containing protein [Clostridia bacterium]|nr:carbohydrate-binding domain-containing protein [Clostridia bacterium]
MITRQKPLYLIAAVILAAALALSGCGKTLSLSEATRQNSQTAAVTESTGATETAAVTSAASDPDMFTDRDYEVGYDASTVVTVTLNGATAACGDTSVVIADGTVTLTQEGEYLITGTYTGSVLIDMDKSAKPHIILSDVSITSETGAALQVAQADKVFVTLADGTANTLANGGSFTDTENGVDGAVFSKDDITFNGTGTLSVSSPAGHGIVGKDDVVFTGGAYYISAASHGVDANDSVRVANASLTINAGKDGIHCENTEDTAKGFVYIAGGSLLVDAQGDGVSAGADLTVEDGAIDIVAGGGSANAEKQTSDGWGQFGGMGGMPGRPGGGEGGGRPDMGGEKPDMSGGMTNLSYSSGDGDAAESAEADADSTSIKGVKAGGSIVINGGAVTVDSADDSIHANGSVTVTDGTLTLTSGDDGIHADETLTVSGGAVTVTESYEGLEALSINIGGGVITIDADDDGLNAAGGSDESGFGGLRGGDMFGGKGGFGATEGAEINIAGGQLSIRADGDGIDSNGAVSISGGNTLVDCPTMGDTSPFDYETAAAITGGTLIATGSSMMAEGFTSAAQGVINGRLGEQAGGTTLTVTDAEGNTILSTTPDNAYNYILISTPELISGQSYTLTVGDYSDSVTAS